MREKEEEELYCVCARWGNLASYIKEVVAIPPQYFPCFLNAQCKVIWYLRAAYGQINHFQEVFS